MSVKNLFLLLSHIFFFFCDFMTEFCAKNPVCIALPLENCLAYNNCHENEEKQCFENNEEGKCQLLTCEQLSSDKCFLHGSIIDYKICVEKENGDGCTFKGCEEETNVASCGIYPKKGERQCVINDDYDGCEYKSCEELSSSLSSFHCDDFVYPDEDSDRICVDNGKGGCETKKCSTYDGNCADLILQFGYKCEGTKGNCSPKMKECSDFKPDECTSYYYGDTTNYKGKKKCVTNDLNTGCELKTCESLSNENCHKYNHNIFNDEKCIADEDLGHCKIIYCEDLKSNECDKFGDFDEFGEAKCLPGGEGCIITGCLNMDPDKCQNFKITHSKCIRSEDEASCYMIPKDCEELDVNNCDQYRPYRPEDKGKKCKLSKDKTKCQLTNECGTIFSYLYILLFLLLF